MEIGSLLTWWQWAILGAVPPGIILLYFLKLRRQPLEVPSTYLWRKSIEDLHVNSLWQKMRQSLLLFLQLAFVALIFLALLRPYWQGSRLSGDRFIFLVDNSASMRATDVDRPHPGPLPKGEGGFGSRTRLDEAKNRIAGLIDEMKSGDSAMLISFSDSARVEQQYTESRHDLQRALAAIPQTNHPTSLDEALRVASGLANPKKSGDKGGVDTPFADAVPADLYIFSDGKFPDVADFSLGNLRPVFVPIGDPEANNVGITAFSVRRNEERADKLQAYFNIENFGGSEVTTQVELFHNDETDPIDVKQVKIAAGKATSDVFDLNDIDEGTLRLKIDVQDVFALDNAAFAVVGATRRAKVLIVTPGNEALELAAGTSGANKIAEVSLAKPEILAKPEFQKAAAGGAYDLIIFDRCQPKEMPQANTLFIGRLPPVGWTAGEKIVAPIIIDTDHAHPLMQAVELGDVIVGEGLPLKPPPGSAKLIDSHKGTLFAIAPREGFEDAVLGFELVGTDDKGVKFANTNWTVKLSFPAFVLNALNYLGGRRDVESSGTVRPGQPMELHSETAADHVTVVAPRGRKLDVQRGKQGKFQFSGTDDLGVYEVRDGDKITERFTVNLFDRAESDIRPRDKNGIKIGYVPVEAQTHWEPARQEAWKWLVLAALVLLVFEWYIFNRRVYL